MFANELLNKIKKLNPASSDSFNVIDYKDYYYGLDKDGNIVFLMNSLNSDARSLAQSTNQLYLGQNISCLVNTEKDTQKGIFDILICFDKDPKHILTFLYLTSSYAEAIKINLYGININIFFDSLKSLFSNKDQLPISKLQGLYGELYFINYMNLNGIDISVFWQSEEKMKFDFSIDEKRKIEVKTTISDTRKHKFRHEQLVSDIYETWIVSFLLRKDDKGLSLLELSETVKKDNLLNIQLQTYITKLLNNYSDDELHSIKFNKNYAENNLKFYKTLHIPKFAEKEPKGVTNTEYESDLTSVEYSTIAELIDWLK